MSMEGSSCSDLNAVFLQELARCIYGVCAFFVLYRCELVFSDDFVGQAAVHHMDHIEHQILEFVAVGRFRFHFLAVFVQARDFFLDNMDRQFLAADIFQTFQAEQVIQGNAEIVEQISVFVRRFLISSVIS